MGRASAIALAQAGWSIALLARRADMLEETKALCVDSARVLLVEGDVAREEDVKRLFQATIDAFGERSRSFLLPPRADAFAKNGRASGHALQRSHLIVFSASTHASNSPGAFQNAGRGHAQVPIEELSLDAFQQVINVNLIGTFLCTREAVRIFKAQSPQGGACIAVCTDYVPAEPGLSCGNCTGTRGSWKNAPGIRRQSTHSARTCGGRLLSER